MTAELALFILVAAVAIFSAALMMVSRNAVHSALFLVINLLCVAFFYLMLTAPFLAMVQITVYAGAIMVLFMFVIMLLGAERLTSGSAKYPWIAPTAAGLATIFLLVAFVAIVQGNIELLQPVPRRPEVRVIHSVAGAPAIDVYVNDQRLAENLGYGETTELTAVDAGPYNLLVFVTCTLDDRTQCPDPITTGVAPLLALPLTLEAAVDQTLLVAGTPDAPQVLRVPTDFAAPAGDRLWRLTVVNALPGAGPASLVAERSPASPSAETVLVPAQAFGDAAATFDLPEGDYDLVFTQGTRRLAAFSDFDPDVHTHELLILTQETVSTALDGQTQTRPTVLHVAPVRTRDPYGSPQQIGIELLTTYLLPFQMVALLLLATMVGAIILVREDVVRRARRRVVVSPVVKRLNWAQAQAERSRQQNDSPDDLQVGEPDVETPAQVEGSSGD